MFSLLAIKGKKSGLRLLWLFIALLGLPRFIAAFGSLPHTVQLFKSVQEQVSAQVLIQETTQSCDFTKPQVGSCSRFKLERVRRKVLERTPCLFEPQPLFLLCCCENHTDFSFLRETPFRSLLPFLIRGPPHH